MSDDAYEPSEHIDWDLVDEDHTFEWLVHLCEVFNRGEEPDHYITWPEDYLWNSNHTSIPEEHRQMWLHVADLICRSPGITVSENGVSVTGRFGTEFEFEMKPDLSGWGRIDPFRRPDRYGRIPIRIVSDEIEISQKGNPVEVPEELHHLLCLEDLLHGKDQSDRDLLEAHEILVLADETSISLCWRSPEGIPTPVGLNSLLLAMLDETKIWEYLLDWLYVECWNCLSLSHDGRGGAPLRREHFEEEGRIHSDENNESPYIARLISEFPLVPVWPNDPEPSKYYGEVRPPGPYYFCSCQDDPPLTN